MKKLWKKLTNWFLGRGFTSGTGIYNVPKGATHVHVVMIGGGGGGSGTVQTKEIIRNQAVNNKETNDG